MSDFSNYIFGVFIGVVLTNTFIYFMPKIIKSDHPLTPHKEIKVDANGDSTITYIYKLD